MSIIKKEMKTTYENTFGVFITVNMAIASIYLKTIDVKTKEVIPDALWMIARQSEVLIGCDQEKSLNYDVTSGNCHVISRYLSAEMASYRIRYGRNTTSHEVNMGDVISIYVIITTYILTEIRCHIS